mmetsp:Transcript_12619/g.22757  ORF Transcript_12619/g.22757 Transcript_12619/m.22757 type:complete len:399 (-) Transcript_12619:11-1207(-)
MDLKKIRKKLAKVAANSLGSSSSSSTTAEKRFSASINRSSSDSLNEYSQSWLQFEKEYIAYTELHSICIKFHSHLHHYISSSSNLTQHLTLFFAPTHNTFQMSNQLHTLNSSLYHTQLPSKIDPLYHSNILIPLQNHIELLQFTQSLAHKRFLTLKSMKSLVKKLRETSHSYPNHVSTNSNAILFKANGLLSNQTNWTHRESGKDHDESIDEGMNSTMNESNSAVHVHVNKVESVVNKLQCVIDEYYEIDTTLYESVEKCHEQFGIVASKIVQTLTQIQVMIAQSTMDQFMNETSESNLENAVNSLSAGFDFNVKVNGEESESERSENYHGNGVVVVEQEYEDLKEEEERKMMNSGGGESRLTSVGSLVENGYNIVHQEWTQSDDEDVLDEQYSTSMP